MRKLVRPKRIDGVLPKGPPRPPPSYAEGIVDFAAAEQGEDPESKPHEHGDVSLAELALAERTLHETAEYSSVRTVE